ncbi:MAG: efflux RND transporter periplasmic adaptor subunit [Firmicutes bacterium]|nr:efflux RND transporter periplasmic adaptor subunit [Bacillota bacterium]
MDEDIIKLKKKRKLKRIIIVSVIVLIVAGLIIFNVINSKKLSKIVFETQKAEKGKIVATVSSTGSLSAVTTVDVGSQVSGAIQAIYVDYNDKVTEGQIIARIDPATYEVQLSQAKAKLESGEAQLRQAQADLDDSKISVQNAIAGIHQATASVDKAKADLQNIIGNSLVAEANMRKNQAELDNKKAENKRAQELYRRELISQSEKDSYDLQLKTAQADYESANAQVKASKANIDASRSNLKSAYSNLDAAKIKKDSAEAQVRAAAAKLISSHATIDQAKGDVNAVQVNLERCIIRSPINGIVINRKVDVGQTVAASFTAPSLFIIAKNLENMEVKASVDEADIGKVKQGQKVKFTVDAYPDEDFVGTVFQVRTNAVVESNVVTYEVIIRTDNKGLKLKPGMTANIDITVETKENVLRVPNSALRFRPDKIANFPFPEDMKNGNGNSKSKGKGKGKPSGIIPGPGGPPPGGPGGKGDTAEEGKSSKSSNEATLWILKNDKPARVKITTGISDSSYTEVVSGDIAENTEIITDAYTEKERQSKEKTERKSVRIRL